MNLLLNDLLKEYVNIFIDEYSNYLNKESLEILKNIDYDHIINFSNVSNPIGSINLDQIYLSDSINELITTMKNMDNYGQRKYYMNNRNYTSYLKYVCDNGYDAFHYYSDHLMYFVFKLVIPNNSGLINGLISQEVDYLSRKYNFSKVDLYSREHLIAQNFSKLFDNNISRKLIFMDKVSAFRYLSENVGYKYAKLFYDISNLIDSKYLKIQNKKYIGFDGVVNYAKDYDDTNYSEVYNHLLDFKVETM